jgi:di/tricarboxylate transporter
MLGFQVATCILSMWISNTATTAMMVPIAMAVIYELHEFSRSTSIAADSTVLHLDALEVQYIYTTVNQMKSFFDIIGHFW